MGNEMMSTKEAIGKPIGRPKTTEAAESTRLIKSIDQFRADFPILNRDIRGKRLAYLDSAATTQKPKVVLDALQHYYENTNSNIHRSVYHLSALATEAFESARKTVQKFLNAADASECIFVKGTTEAINLVAQGFTTLVKPEDEILVSMMEHHANIVPWQMLCQRTGAKLTVIPMNDKGELCLDNLDQLLNKKTKLVAISHVSNVLGTIHPIQHIINKAHTQGIPVLVDGAQSAPHLKIDVQKLNCDFYTFSGHKVYGPTGIGVLYGKSHWLNKLPPYQGGGEMIKKVSFTETTYQDLPYKFEAGTPPIAAAIGLKTALDYLMNIDFLSRHQQEQNLKNNLISALKMMPRIQIVGDPAESIGIISFIIKGIHPHDIGSLADEKGVALRTGHHCAMPIMEYYGLPATTRISLGIYNNQEDIEQLLEALDYVQTVFK